MTPQPPSPSTTLPHEHIEDFTSLPWCNTLLSSPSITHISKRHIPDTRAGVSNTFFTRTLFTSGALRACLTLYRPGPGHVREVDSSIIFTGSAPLHDAARAGHFEVEAARQAAKADISYDTQDSNLPEIILLVSIGSDIDGGIARLHGGVTASLLDQAMGTLLSYYFENTSATSELKVRYKRAIDTPCVVQVRAKLKREKGRWIETWGSVEDGEGTVYAEGEGAFVLGRVGEAKM